MLSVSPLRRTKDEFESQREMEGFAIVAACDDDDFEFSYGNLLESINFDDFLVGAINGDVLPDLEMDPEILAEFSVSGGEVSSEMNRSLVSVENNNNNGSSDNNNIESDQHQIIVRSTKKDEDGKYNNKVCSASGSGFSDADSGSSSRGGEEIVKQSPKEASKARKSSAQSKNSQGKRKVKVDWTPELHRRFVQAVEQLGVENAVPSKILEIMGIACLTRHNIASHLQKYRSHRKHLLAREAEAASWSQRRQIYGGGGKGKVSPCLALTLGYPQMVPPMHHFRPLHVWGHPTMDHSFMPMWPQPHHHLPHQTSAPPPPPTASAPAFTPPPPLDPSFWFQQRFGSPPVPGIPPHAMFNVDPGISIHTRQPSPVPGWPILDFHPSKESIDAAIEDVVSKPRLPLPLGLKAPALGSVLGELQRKGISKIPPSCA